MYFSDRPNLPGGRTISQEIPLFPFIRYSGDLSSANSTSIPILGAVMETAKLPGRDVEIEGLVTNHVDEAILGLNWLQAKGADWNNKKTDR